MSRTDEQRNCYWCGIALNKSRDGHFCRHQHAEMFANRIIDLGFPQPHTRTPWCDMTQQKCAHLPLSETGAALAPPIAEEKP